MTINHNNYIKEYDKSTFQTLKDRKSSDLMNTSHIDAFK